MKCPTEHDTLLGVNLCWRVKYGFMTRYSEGASYKRAFTLMKVSFYDGICLYVVKGMVSVLGYVMHSLIWYMTVYVYQ